MKGFTSKKKKLFITPLNHQKHLMPIAVFFFIQIIITCTKKHKDILSKAILLNHIFYLQS